MYTAAMHSHPFSCYLSYSYLSEHVPTPKRIANYAGTKGRARREARAHHRVSPLDSCVTLAEGESSLLSAGSTLPNLRSEERLEVEERREEEDRVIGPTTVVAAAATGNHPALCSGGGGTSGLSRTARESPSLGWS